MTVRIGVLRTRNLCVVGGMSDEHLLLLGCAAGLKERNYGCRHTKWYAGQKNFEMLCVLFRASKPGQEAPLHLRLGGDG